MTKSTKQLIQELKRSKDGIHRFENKGNHYGLLILQKGELLFFQQNEAALICEVSARYSLIDPSSIKEWDNGKTIGNAEREALLSTIQALYKQAYKDELKPFSQNG